MSGYSIDNMRKDSYRKRISIVENATEMFIELGYAKASMNLLVKRTGCSKSTLYKHFESKEALFIAVIDEALKDHLYQLQELDLANMSLEQGLSKIARAGLDVITSHKHVSICRIVYAEAERIPIVGQIYYEHGPKRGISGVAFYLKQMVSAGEIKCKNPSIAAEHFWGMLLHKPMLERYCGLTKPMSKTKANRYVNKIVKEFMDSCISKTAKR